MHNKVFLCLFNKENNNSLALNYAKLNSATMIDTKPQAATDTSAKKHIWTGTTIKSLKTLSSFTRVQLIAATKKLRGKRPGETSKAFEVDFWISSIINIDVIDRDPKHHVLGFHTRDFGHLLGLQVARHRLRVATQAVGFLEVVLLLLLHTHPYKPCLLHIPSFHHIFQGEQSSW
eukprot:c18596_g1_i1 orf=139-663(+)